MERSAHYALVGLISTLILILGVVFVMWLAHVQFTRAYTFYDIDFKGPVRGLSTGGDVFFNGIKVGEVTKLRLDVRDPNRVVARIRTTSDAPVRLDTTASLEPLGVTGVNYVQLTAGTIAKPLLLSVTPAGVTPVIHASQSQLDSLLEGGGTVLARTVEALDRVNKLLSDRNVASFSATLTNVQRVTAEVGDQRRLLDDLDTTARSANAAAIRIANLADTADTLINGQGRTTLRELSQAAVQIRATAVDLHGLTETVAGPAGDFATTGLPQLGRAVTALQRASETLDRLAGEVEQNPRQLIGKPPAKTLEVRP